MMADVEADQEKAAEEQVLSWVYEYAVKFNYACVIACTENIAEIHGISSFPSSATFAYYLRRLKQISDYTNTENVNQMHQLTIELLRLRQYQENAHIYNQIILINIASKLLLFNKEVVNQDTLQELLPHFNWQNLKQKYNLLNDNYKKKFKMCISWARQFISNSISSKERILHLSEFTLFECRNNIETAQQRLIELLCDVFPDTAIEKIFCSQEICEQFAQQEFRAYTDLMKLVEKEVTETSLIDFLDILFEHREKTFIHSETVKHMENGGLTSSNRVRVEKERSSKFSPTLKSGSEENVLIDNKVRCVKTKRWGPLRFPEPPTGTDVEVLEKVVQDKGLSESPNQSKPDSLDSVCVNGKPINVTSKQWHPVNFCRSTYVDSASEFSQTGPFNAVEQKGIPSLEMLESVDSARNHKEFGKDRCKQLPCSRNILRSTERGNSNGGDAEGLEETVQDRKQLENPETSKANSFDSVWANGKLIKVKSKPWHPVNFSRSLHVISASKSSQTGPFQQKEIPTQGKLGNVNLTGNHEDIGEGSHKQLPCSRNISRPVDGSNAKLLEARGLVLSHSVFSKGDKMKLHSNSSCVPEKERPSEFPATLKVKKKLWHPILSGHSDNCDPNVSDDVMQAKELPGIPERLKSNKLDSLWINGKKVEIKNKSWHPVSFCRSVSSESYSSEKHNANLSKVNVHKRSLATERSVTAELANHKESRGIIQGKRPHLPDTPQPANDANSKLQDVKYAASSSDSSEVRELEKLITELESMLHVLKQKLSNIKCNGDNSASVHQYMSTSDTGKNSDERSVCERNVNVPGFGSTSLHGNSDFVGAVISSTPTFVKGNNKLTSKSKRKANPASVTKTNPFKPNVEKNSNGGAVTERNVRKTSNENTVPENSSDLEDFDTTFYSALDNTRTQKTEKDRETKRKRLCTQNEEEESRGTRRKKLSTSSSHPDDTYHTAFESQSDAVIKACYVPLQRICTERKESLCKKKSRIKGAKGKKGT